MEESAAVERSGEEWRGVERIGDERGGEVMNDFDLRTIGHDLFHSPPGVELFVPEKYYSMTWCV